MECASEPGAGAVEFGDLGHMAGGVIYTVVSLAQKWKIVPATSPLCSARIHFASSSLPRGKSTDSIFLSFVSSIGPLFEGFEKCDEAGSPASSRRPRPAPSFSPFFVASPSARFLWTRMERLCGATSTWRTVLPLLSSSAPHLAACSELLGRGPAGIPCKCLR